MHQTNHYCGRNPIHIHDVRLSGETVRVGGEEFYRITHYDRMRPFFMSVVSNADHWMFISSSGALTAGRQNPDSALFPYYTDDKIHDAAEITGSKTVLWVKRARKNFLWEPFSQRHEGSYRIQRNLYKNFRGNQLRFEETNEDLGLVFTYGWFSSERFGFVRKCALTNAGNQRVGARFVDGIQNLMPSGIGSQFQLEKSTLLDAYKKNELVAGSGLGLFRLSSIPLDRPEPAEALRATTAFALGLERATRLLCARQLERFRQGLPLEEETDIRAERGAYFVASEVELGAGQTKRWLIAADVNRGPSQVAALEHLLQTRRQTYARIEADIARGTADLEQIVAGADGLQKTALPLGDARHFANVLFNVMRGGVFERAYEVHPGDLREFVQQANRAIARRRRGFFRALEQNAPLAGTGRSAGDRAPYQHREVCGLAARTGDANLERLCWEYLPLAFSRRHGDPSRPWNRFNIAPRNADGTRSLHYEGNWRDIFQNWEALAVSFPGFAANMVCRFVNASTADGYNPYRITREGIDWEVSDPADPWSHIGYWGDHQVIYLLKLLEIVEAHEPAMLRDFLTRKLFSYANVPYRIKPYERLLQSPKETVEFDRTAHELALQRVKASGSDGKLVWDQRDEVRLVNLSEKLLVSLLAKLSNFIPDGGIWLNTQRPEWNDANNALVGNGVSMVTLYYVRRYLAFSVKLFQSLPAEKIELSQEVARLLQRIRSVLEEGKLAECRGSRSEERRARWRKKLLDGLGRAGSDYRQELYSCGLCGRTVAVEKSRILEFLNLALNYADESLRSNRRDDGLYHAYNLVGFGRQAKLGIRRLYEMLEGQVAVLSSGRLSAKEGLDLLQALKRSALYRADQHSYLLYPDRRLSRFVERNNIPGAALWKSELLRRLVKDGNALLVERDVRGRLHFNGALTNAADVRRVLEKLAEAGYERLVRKDREQVLQLFEQLFDHQSFTGRSGTFFGYEGLGCIYWHMVSKLLLAAQETFFQAVEAQAPGEIVRQLAACYHDIRAGLGDRKPALEYGAFPMDPYSHTPGAGGARQPGLTGQVKEDILCRWGELGVKVAEGRIFFRPLLLRREEVLRTPAEYGYYDVSGTSRRLALPAGSIAFSYCQVPVVYRLARKNGLSVWLEDGSRQQQEQMCLDAETSASIFNRTGRVRRVVVGTSNIEP